MWPILLKILSIIGIVLGCIVGLILLLLLFVLLCPICYKADGEFHGGDKKIRVKLRYLLGLVRGDYIYPEPGNIVFKVAWYTLYDSGAEDEVEDAAENAAGNVAEKETENVTGNENVSEASGEGAEVKASGDTSSVSKTVKNVDSETKTCAEEPREAADAGAKTATAEKPKKEPLKSPIYYIKKAFESFKHKVIAKIKLFYKEFNFYKKLLFHEDTKKLISIFKKQLIKILKVIIPKKGRCNIEYGTGSPDTTAYIFGAYSVLFVKKYKRYIVVPNFEEKMIEGDFKIKGYFNLISIIVKALPIVFSKKLRLTKARLDRHFENMEKAKRKEEKRHDTTLGALEEEYSVS